MKKSTTNKLLENCLNQLDVQQIDEGLWDRTKAKAAGLGSFITGKFGEKSKSYQTTAQSKLIDSKINKIKKIISDLEVDIIKSTGLRMADIQSKYPNIYSELQKISNAINAPLNPQQPQQQPQQQQPQQQQQQPSKPTFSEALDNWFKKEGLWYGGLDYQTMTKFLKAHKADPVKILNAAKIPSNRGTQAISREERKRIEKQLILAGIFAKKHK